MAESGYYPVIVTRNWDRQIESPEDVLRSSGEEISHTKTEKNEVYALPYKASLRDRIFVKNQGSPIQKISRVLTFFNLIAENFWLKAIPHCNLYYFARKLIKENDDFHAVIISGNPFNQFSFGYHLNKEFGTKWIADYRDDWNTDELSPEKKGLNAFIQKFQVKSEKKWVGSAARITSVSDYYVSKISKFTGVKGNTIHNGYELSGQTMPNHLSEEFILTYNGSLYDSQRIEPILAVVQKLITEGYTELKVKFPGLSFSPSQANRVQALTREIQNHIEITNRIPKIDVLRIQAESDLLLMIAHTNIKGVPSSKLYEYIGLRKPVLLFPSDEDVIEEILNEVGLGIIPKDENDLYHRLKSLLDQKREGLIEDYGMNLTKIESYSRKEQTRTLAKILDNL